MALQEHIVYGPVRSRRLGRSLGINLLPIGMKVCNLNCAYCQYGLTRGASRYRHRSAGWPTADAVASAVEERLARAATTNELIDRITVAGHGEPTLHPEFGSVVERLRAVRDRIAPAVPLAILSNSTTAAWPEVRRALTLFDERHMKLDAGDPITYSLINGPGISLTEIVDALSGVQKITIQSMFVRDRGGQIDNTTDGAVREWLQALEQIRPARVHIYTLERPSARPGLCAVPIRRLREICEHVRSTGFVASVFASRGRRVATGEEPCLRPHHTA